MRKLLPVLLLAASLATFVAYPPGMSGALKTLVAAATSAHGHEKMTRDVAHRLETPLLTPVVPVRISDPQIESELMH